jgi:hypothetical protein
MIQQQRDARHGWRSLLILAGILLCLAVPLYAALGTGGTSPVVGKEKHGTLVASDGKHIYDWQLDRLINRHIGNRYYSKILCFTECYGGDKIDDFAGDRNTTILSGSQAGKITIYDGYHRGLAIGLRPGSTTTAAHQAGIAHKLGGDTPTSNGPVQDIGVGGASGAIQSCHVLVWAGLPNELDQADINDIRNNFAGQPNTTVTVLSGNGAGADGRATMTDLVTALRNIGAMMNPNEQFILFVTDHGNLDSSAKDVYLGGGDTPVNGGHTDVILGINPNLYQTMVEDTGNDPFLAFFTVAGAPPISPGTLTFTFNGTGPYTVGFNVQEIAHDYDADGVADQYEYLVPLAESTIVQGDNTIALNNTNSSALTLEFVSLDSGAIQRPYPSGIHP